MKAKDIFWVIVSPLAPLLVLAGMLLYASSLMFTIPIGIIVFIIKGIIEDDKRKKFFEQLRVDRVKQYPKDEYGKPLWEELDVSKSVESLLVETNNDTKSAIACAKKQIDIAVQRLDQLDEQLILDGIERAKWLSSIDKWNSIIIGIKKVDKDNKKYNIKKAFQIFLASIIAVGLIAFTVLLITSYIPQKNNTTKNSTTKATHTHHSQRTDHTTGNSTYNFTSGGLAERSFKEMLDTMKFFNESITPISSSLRVGNSISTTAATVTQTMTISELYKKAHDRGVLKSGLTEEQFTKQISTDDGLRSFYNYATTKGGMKFHPYDEFKQRIGWEKEFAHSRCESEELKQMLLLSDSIEIYRDIDEEYYNHPIVYTPIKTSVASSVPKHKTTQTSEKMVYICTGPSAYRYHSRSSCRGLNRCSDDIERVTISEARDLGRTPCGYCY